MKKEQTEIVWNTIGENFGYPESQRSFKLPKPYIIFDISSKYSYETDELEDMVLTAMRACTRKNELIYAMDWQHECYEFDPRKPIERDEWKEWLVPLFPNGDYYIFIQKDLKWGYFGHPWKKEIGIFGDCFIKNFNGKNKVLDTIIKKKDKQ